MIGGRGGASEVLEPLLVDVVGRGGSTALMRLLEASPAVVVEGPYPYERRYFRYLSMWAGLLDGAEWSSQLWGQEELATFAPGERQRGLVGPPPWRPRELFESGPDERPMSAACFDAAWAELSRRSISRAARAGAPRPRLYAEKVADVWSVDPARLGPARLLVLVRDPRDTFASIEAFNARRGRPSFGRERHRSERDYLEHFVGRHRARLRWCLEQIEGGEVPVLRYEDMVTEPARFAGRLSRRLGVDLPSEVLRDPELLEAHATTPSPESSVGRWRRDLDPGLAQALNRELGPELAELGYA